MGIAKLSDYGLSKASAEDYLDRDHNGSPIIWPEGTDVAAVNMWRATGPSVRDRDGKLRPKGGKAYSRVTKFIDVLDDPQGLVDWKLRMAIRGAADLPTVKLEEIRNMDPDESKGELSKLVDKALELAKADRKASLGTIFHEILEDYDATGELDFVPEEFKAAVDAYVEATKDLEWMAIEDFGVNDEIQVAGTMDRVVRWNGKPTVADLKTGSIYGNGKITRQLATYSHLVRYDAATFERTPMLYDGEPISQDVGLIIHMPIFEGRCDIYEVDLQAGWRSVKLAKQVIEERNFWKRTNNKPKLVRSAS